ncbi:MAG: GTPase Era [Oscillospiraceae bacterium]|jgi:GTP-binding protein Era|nr:GTPase Era [Oscillospiraceae bacterium]
MENSKNLFVAVTGRANAGKSSLVNKLIGTKVAIVSPKPQTTRTRINGVITKGDTQYVFIDTPGMHRANSKLSGNMLKQISAGVSDVDVALLLFDCTKRFSEAERRLLQSMQKENVPCVLVINKADLLHDKGELLPLIERLKNEYDFADIIPMSVRTGANLNALLPALDRFATEGEHPFPVDLATDQSEKFFLSELVREKLLYAMDEEIPHGIAVFVETIADAATNKGEPIVDIGFVIVCDKDSHKGMVIGKKGDNLKNVGTRARADIENYFGCKANIKLFVKVKEDWRNNDKFLTELGLSGNQS